MESLVKAGLVIDHHLTWTQTTNSGTLIELTLEGIIECSGDLYISVTKTLEVRKAASGQVQVRGKYYSYHAMLNKKPEPVIDLVRYCTAHWGIEGLHRHEFNEQGAEVGVP